METVSRRLEAAWAVLLAALSAAPYVAAWLYGPAGYRYLWVLPPFWADSFAYQAWSEQAAQGAWLFQLKYTALPHEPFLFHPLFLLLGRAAAWTGWPLGPLHLAAKTVGVVLFWVAFFRLARRLGLSGPGRAAAAILAGLSSGVGGLLLRLLGRDALGRHLPVDLWLVDSNTFWSLLWNPLFPFSLAATLFFLEALDRASAEGSRAWACVTGGVGAVLISLHPYAVLLVVTLSLGVAGLRRRWDVLPRLLGLAAIPVAYLLWLSLSHPLVAIHQAMGHMDTPSWPALVLGWAPVLFLAPGARRQPLLWSWVLVALLLAQLPVWFQRKALFGVHVALCLLAGASCEALSRRLSLGCYGALILAAAAVALSVPTWAQIAVGVTRLLGQVGRREYYLSESHAQALDFLRARGSPQEIVFASLPTSVLVPALTGKTALWGHWAMSADYGARARWVRQLLHPGGDGAVKARQLWKTVDYALLDGEFKLLRDEGGLEWIQRGGELLFSNEAAVIYGRARAPESSRRSEKSQAARRSRSSGSSDSRR